MMLHSNYDSLISGLFPSSNISLAVIKQNVSRAKSVPVLRRGPLPAAGQIRQISCLYVST